MTTEQDKSKIVLFIRRAIITPLLSTAGGGTISRTGGPHNPVFVVPKIAQRASNRRVFLGMSSAPFQKSIFSQLPVPRFPCAFFAQGWDSTPPPKKPFLRVR